MLYTISVPKNINKRMEYDIGIPMNIKVQYVSERAVKETSMLEKANRSINFNNTLKNNTEYY